eukprot:3107657-Pyramimonas_sp.AAC.1
MPYYGQPRSPQRPQACQCLVNALRIPPRCQIVIINIIIHTTLKVIIILIVITTITISKGGNC